MVKSTNFGLVALRGATILVMLAASTLCTAQAPAENKLPPILFVHGDGDSAAIWYTVLWRFESNGYDPKRLYTLDFSNPTGVIEEDKPQTGRSSAADQLRELSAKVDEIMRQTGESKVALVSHSRGGRAVRDYIKNGGGVANVHIAVLCASPNHGVYASDSRYPTSASNGWGQFIRNLNAGPTEVTPEVKFLTLRSDKNDIFFQPFALYRGLPDVATNIGYDSPVLVGATNVVLPGLDHKQLARDSAAFREIYRFTTGQEPERLDIVAEPHPVLNGTLTGFTAVLPTNASAVGGEVKVYEVSQETGERIGSARHRKIVGADGLWGPFEAKPDAYYEFVLTVAGYPVTHIYEMPFPRSTAILQLRPALWGEGDKEAGSIIGFFRRNANIGLGRDTVLLDGQAPSGMKSGPPATNEVKYRLAAGDQRPLHAIINTEQMTVRAWPVAENHVVIAEFHY